MVRASMATRNKRDVPVTNNTGSQFNNEVNMGKFPGLHRRAILVIAVIVLVVFFWPTSENNGPSPQSSALTQDLPVPIAPSISTMDPIDQTALPSAQESLNADKDPNAPTQGSSITNNNDGEVTSDLQTPDQAKTWQTYTIKEGQTLAQLFRDNQLPVNDAFAMAKSEDQQKSLSQLRSGQTIRLQRNPQGDVSMLEVTNSMGVVITYTRLSDGSYYRTP